MQILATITTHFIRLAGLACPPLRRLREDRRAALERAIEAEAHARFLEEMAELDAQIEADAAYIAACDHRWSAVEAHKAVLDGQEVCHRCGSTRLNPNSEDLADFLEAEEDHRLAGLEHAANDALGLPTQITVMGEQIDPAAYGYVPDTNGPSFDDFGGEIPF